tara:strand:+ start:147 stop:689 length:543 start_codon:yes stop_codon:yes gene_type:complete
MIGYIYLIKKGDLYSIGSTNDIEKKMSSIEPDKILKTIKLDNPISLEARLFRRYKSVRLPESSYFRLTEEQLQDCENQLSPTGKLPKTFEAEFSITLTVSCIVFILTFLISKILGIQFINSISISLAFASFPMWLLFIFGNFGGYYSEDLSLFSSWGNRSKALFAVIAFSTISYLFFQFH